MTSDRKVADVFETRDYDKFKKLLGNRDVTDKRINKITTSIKNVGYVLNPIVVNGNFEIIDGQGRVEALRRLDMPVHYVIDRYAGLEQCVQLNVNGTPWNTYDYIESYKIQGNHNYENLSALIDEYEGISVDVISYAVLGKTRSKHYESKRNDMGCRSSIITGAFVCGDAEKEAARVKLNYVKRFEKIAKKAPGSASFFMKAIIFMAFTANANKERLYKTCYERQQNMIPFTNMKTAINSISEIYNLAAKKRIEFESIYIISCSEKNAAYLARWGNEEEAT